jgi:hypothetical protein
MHDISFEDVTDYAQTGKVIMAPDLSRCRRPVLLMRTRMEDTPNSAEGNVRHFAYQMEMIARCRFPGEQCTVHARANLAR